MRPWISCFRCLRWHWVHCSCLTPEEKEEAATFPCYWGWHKNLEKSEDIPIRDIPYLEFDISEDALKQADKESDKRFDSLLA